MAICELICVGTELLLGEILNTNAQYLCQRLAEYGISVQRVLTVGDNPTRLREDVSLALSRSDMVILTGGLGPTSDDITKEIVCEALSLPLEEDSAQMANIEAFFRDRGLPFVESNRKQAMVPKGCTVLYNKNGTAPGCWIPLKEQSKAVALLPGPPRELQRMFETSLAEHLNDWRSGVIVSHHVRTIDLGEGRMAELAGALLDSENPTVAPYAKEGESYLRVSGRGETAEAAEALCFPVIGKLKDLLGESVYSIDKPMEQTVCDLLKEQGKTIALAESCTGGGICAQLTERPGASAFFGWGFVTYANEAKVSLLGVSPETLERFGAVSEECALEMAQGARRASGADIGVAVTGIAGPGGETEGKPVGLIYLCAADETHVLRRKLETGRDDRGYNRVAAAKQALNLARKLLQMNREQRTIAPDKKKQP